MGFTTRGDILVLHSLLYQLHVCVFVWVCVCVCVCVALLNQHRNTRFTAPACQDSLWPQGFHHLPAHPVETKTVQDDESEGWKGKEEKTEG